MERDERWLEKLHERDPWLDHAHEDPRQQDRIRPATKSRNGTREFREYFLQQVRHFREKTLNTFDRYTLAETLSSSVLMMLISFATFWMCFIFVILGGSILISMHLITLTANCGRRMQKFAASIRTRSNVVPVDQGQESAKQRTISTSAATPDSNS